MLEPIKNNWQILLLVVVVLGATVALSRRSSVPRPPRRETSPRPNRASRTSSTDSIWRAGRESAHHSSATPPPRSTSAVINRMTSLAQSQTNLRTPRQAISLRCLRRARSMSQRHQSPKRSSGRRWTPRDTPTRTFARRDSGDSRCRTAGHRGQDRRDRALWRNGPAGPVAHRRVLHPRRGARREPKQRNQPA